MASAPQEALPLELTASETSPPVEFGQPAAGPTRYTMFTSPIGELLLTSDGSALTGLHLGPSEDASPRVDPAWRHEPAAFSTVEKQLAAYFAGELHVFDLPLAPKGTVFQRRAWQALTTIPYGQTASYGAIAAAIGHPTASRAVGGANNRNPISILIPCHRVVGANGALVGYGGGLSRKERLLYLERGGRL